MVNTIEIVCRKKFLLILGSLFESLFTTNNEFYEKHFCTSVVGQTNFSLTLFNIFLWIKG